MQKDVGLLYDLWVGRCAHVCSHSLLVRLLIVLVIVLKMATTETFTQRGGLRIGIWNFTWPFARLVADASSITIHLWFFGTRSFTFEKANIKSLERYWLLLTPGLRIRHSCTQTLPDSVIFWTYNFQALRVGLEGLGYHVQE